MFPRPHLKPRPALLTQDEPEQAAQQASLSRELSEFLIELSIGVHRYAMYPAGHPSHEPVLDNIIRRLIELFVNRTSVSIGVAARQPKRTAVTLPVRTVATPTVRVASLPRAQPETEKALSRSAAACNVSRRLQKTKRTTERPPSGVL